MQQHLLQYFKILKEKAVEAFNGSEIQSADCYLFSKEIVKTTGKTVSETTIKRVFGHTTSKHSPSRYTLDALSQYCGYNSWTEFIEKQDELSITNSDHQDWDSLKNHVSKITRFNIFAADSKLKNKHAINLKQPNLENALLEKLNIEYNFRVLHGVANSGKTLSVLKSLKTKMSENNENIYLYLDCNTLFHGAIYGFNPYKWISVILDFGNEELIKQFCNNYKDSHLGEIHIIFDGFNDELLPDKHFNAFLSNFLDLAQYFVQYPWIQITLITRTHIFKKIKAKIDKEYINNEQKPLYIDMNSINALSINDVSQLLLEYDISHTINEISNPIISQWFKKPYLIETYLYVYSKNPLIHFKTKESLYITIHQYYWKNIDFKKYLKQECKDEVTSFLKGIQCLDFMEPQFIEYNYRLKNNLLYKSPLYNDMVSFGLIVEQDKHYKFESILFKAYLISIFVYHALNIKNRKEFLDYVHLNFEHSVILKSAITWFTLFSIEEFQLDDQENDLKEFEYLIKKEEVLYRKLIFLQNFHANSSPEIKKEIEKHVIKNNYTFNISYYKCYTYKQLRNLYNVLLNMDLPKTHQNLIQIKLLNISFFAWDEIEIYKNLEKIVVNNFEGDEFSVNVVPAYSALYHYFKNSEIPESLMKDIFPSTKNKTTFKDELITFELLTYILMLIDNNPKRTQNAIANINHKIQHAMIDDIRIISVYKKLIKILEIKLNGTVLEDNDLFELSKTGNYTQVDSITIIDKVLQLHIDMNRSNYNPIQITKQEENIKQILEPLGYNLLNKYFSIAGRYILSKKTEHGINKLVFDVNQLNNFKNN